MPPVTSRVEVAFARTTSPVRRHRRVRERPADIDTNLDPHGSPPYPLVLVHTLQA